MKYFESKKEFYRALTIFKIINQALKERIPQEISPFSLFHTINYIALPRMMMRVSIPTQLKKIYHDLRKPYQNSSAWEDFFSILELRWLVVRLFMLTILMATILIATPFIIFQKNPKQYAIDVLVGAKNVCAALFHILASAMIVLVATPIKIIRIPFRLYTSKKSPDLEESSGFQFALNKLNEKTESIPQLIDANKAVELDDLLEVQAALATVHHKIERALAINRASTSLTNDDLIATDNNLTKLTGEPLLELKENSQTYLATLKKTGNENEANQAYKTEIKTTLSSWRQAVALFKLPPNSTDDKKDQTSTLKRKRD